MVLGFDCCFNDLYSSCNIIFNKDIIKNNRFREPYLNFFNSSNFNGAIVAPEVSQGINLSQCHNFNSPITEYTSYQETTLSGAVIDLYDCYNFNSTINLINFSPCGRYELYMHNCYNFNQDIPYVTDGEPLEIIYNNSDYLSLSNRYPVCFSMYNCYEFNKPININFNIQSVVNGYSLDFFQMLNYCRNFNSPVTIKIKSLDYSYYVSFMGMFVGSTNFNKPVTIEIEQSSNLVQANSATYLMDFSFSPGFNSNLNLSITQSNITNNVFIRISANDEIENSWINFNINSTPNTRLVVSDLVNTTTYNKPFNFDFLKSTYFRVFMPLIFSRSYLFNHPIRIEDCEGFDATKSGAEFDIHKLLEDSRSFNSLVHIRNISNFYKVDFRGMFAGCSNFDMPVYISDIQASELIDCGIMFDSCKNFNQPVMFNNIVCEGDISLSGMFANCSNFNQRIEIPINTIWCSYMFESCTNFNQPITIPYGVTRCDNMFYRCYNFSQDIYVPDSCQDWYWILRGCSNYKATASVPNNAAYKLGLTADKNTLGATIIYRDTGETVSVVNVFSPRYNQYVIRWSDDLNNI